MLAAPTGGGTLLPVSSLNAITAGARLVYEPASATFKASKKAQIAVILVPADSSAPQILPAKPSGTRAEWPVTMRASAIGVVLGIDGINQKKLAAVLQRDRSVVDHLADYADENSKVEGLVQALSKYEQSAPGSSSLQSVLNEFSSHYGVALPAVDRSKPTGEQASALLKAVTPAFADTPSARPSLALQSGGLAASVASMFFGSPVGLAMGGAALVGNIRTTLFPTTDFQSAFVQDAGANSLALCTSGAKTDARARLASVWMLRLPDADPPSASLAESGHVPMGWHSTVTVRGASVAQLKALPRVREWRLVSNHADVAVPAKVEVGDATDALTLDLKTATIPAGDYNLIALWDWTRVPLAGGIHVRPFSDFSAAKLTPASEDRLVAGTGIVPLTLTDADFEFVDRLTLVRSGANAKVRASTQVTMDDRTDAGDAPTLSASVDTTTLVPGRYALTITQINGAAHSLGVTVHPPNPTLTGLPIKTNVGELKQTHRLRGTALDRIERITSADATWTLQPIPAGARDMTERDVTIELGPRARIGHIVPADLLVTDLHEPISVAGALEVIGPRPTITRIDSSFMGQSGVELRGGEIPAGVPVSFSLHARGIGAHASVRLACEGDGHESVSVAAGQRDATAALDFAGQDTLFLSIDPGRVGAATCALGAAVVNAETGASDPYRLGRVVRVPHIEAFTLSDETIGEAVYAGTLVGESLELIEKTGWSSDSGSPVRGIATPVPGRVGTQTLKIAMPWPSPSPHAPLYIWLRDEKEARLTAARY
jgi:hypothetical protein